MNNVIRDVVFRTNGELYIGVVGSVRTGKSSFIRKFIETKVSPYIDDENLKNKLIDDLPQSSDGKTIMTVEPKFVPSNPININVGEDLNLNIRLVDCVGYVIPSAKGYLLEDGSPRLVKTPWKEEEIPFQEAANLGTKKVIENHSHIGIVLTSDGSFGEFTRDEYELVEEKIVNEMKDLQKPFVIVLNTKDPLSDNSKELAIYIKNKYDVETVAINALTMTDEDINEILRKALSEFDISKLELNVPVWLSNLDSSIKIKKEYNELLDVVTTNYRKFKQVEMMVDYISTSRLFAKVNITNLDAGSGFVSCELQTKDELFDEVLEELLGDIIDDKARFIEFIQTSINAQKIYNHYKDAIEEAQQTGYGISVPLVEEMELDVPQILKQGNRYGIKINAKAPSLHIIKVDVTSSFEPIIGTEDQARILLDELENEEESSIWDTQVFGRKLSDVVNDGIRSKLLQLKDQDKQKFKESLEKVINSGRGGMITILL